MASRTLQISEKDIRQERRIVWPSLDVCKGRNYSKVNKIYLRFPPLQKPEWRGFRRRARVSERKRRSSWITHDSSALLFTADLSALTSIIVRRCPCTVLEMRQFRGLQRRIPESAKVSKYQSFTVLDLCSIIKRGGRSFCHPTDTY